MLSNHHTRFALSTWYFWDDVSAAARLGVSAVQSMNMYFITPFKLGKSVSFNPGDGVWDRYGFQ